MRVDYLDRRYSVLFYANKVPSRITKIAETELVNDFVSLDNRIKDFLLEIIKNKKILSQITIAKTLDLSVKKLSSRIYKNDELRNLWNKIYSLTLDKFKNDNDKIKKILEDIINSNEQVSANDIAQRAGLTLNACLMRIKRYSELNFLYMKISHVPTSQKTDDSKKLDNAIKEFLENCIKNKIKVFAKDVAAKVGLSEENTKDRIYRTPVLQELWTQAGHISTSEKLKKSEEKNLLIKSAIQKAIDESISTSITELAESLGMHYSECQQRIAKSSELKSLWAQAKHKSQSSKQILSDAERIELIKNIENLMQKTLNEQRKITIRAIAKELNVNEPLVTRTIHKTSKLNDLWNKFAVHGGNIKNDTQHNELYVKIQNALNDAINKDFWVTFKDIANEIEIPEPKVKDTIYRNKELKSLWEKVPKRRTYDTDAIKQVLENAISQNRKMNMNDLSEELGIKAQAIRDKMKKKPILKELWKQIERKFVPDSIYQDIKSILETAIKTKTFIDGQAIAKQIGINYPTFYQRIYHNSNLGKLWKQLLNIKDEDNKKLEDKIKAILEQSLEKKDEALLDSMAETLGIKEYVIRHRIKHSQELNDLWTRVKKMNTETLKEFCDFKDKKTDYQTIMKELNISEEKFEELNLKYSKIQSILEYHKGSNISEKEIMEWILLSKREFELAINEILAKMGYKSKTTRYVIDNGIDIIASKNGKTTIIECMHNLAHETEIEELLVLQGNKHYYNADKVIYAAFSGVFKNGEKFAKGIGEDFEVLDLVDIIKLAKEHKIDIKNLKEGENIKSFDAPDYVGNWSLSLSLREEETKKWRNMKPKEFERKVTEFLTSKGYAVKKLDELNLDGYYLINKGGKRSIITCYNKNNPPKIDKIKALYGLKDFYDSDSVILIGTPSISSQSKDFIDKINMQEIKNTYKLISLDKLIEILSKS